jgi:hypothetical protein
VKHVLTASESWHPRQENVGCGIKTRRQIFHHPAVANNRATPFLLLPTAIGASHACATAPAPSAHRGSPYELLAGGRRGRDGRSPSSRVLSRLSLIRRRPSCFVTHAWSLALIDFAFNADSLAPMISLKRWISRSRSCVSDIPVVPRNARDPTLEPHAIMRSPYRSANPHRAVYPRSRNLTHWHKSVQPIARAFRPGLSQECTDVLADRGHT